MEVSQQLASFLLNVSTNIFMELSSHGQILYASDNADDVFAVDNRMGAYLPQLLPAETRGLVISALQEVVRRRRPESLHLEYQNRQYNLFFYPFADRIAACFEDISERRRLAHLLSRARQRLDFAERTAHLGYWELDLQTRRFYWSAEMYRIFGQTAERVSRRRNLIRDGVLPQDLPIYKQQLKKLLGSGQPVEGRVRLRRPPNRIVHCLFRAGFLNLENRRLIAGTFQDISAQIKQQETLEKARRKAEAADQAKSQFLAQASHDLRQPAQALQLFVDALADEKLTAGQRHLVSSITEAVNGLKNLLNNLLDISKLDSGGFCPQPQEFDLREIFCGLCREYVCYPQIKFICRTQSINLCADKIWLERLLRNLLGNALKYTKDKILLSCSRRGNRVYIRVADNGIGIKPDELKLIFEEFYQSANIENNRCSGAGLGLSIVSRIVHLLDGRIRVRSQFGRYSVFEVSFPLRPC